MNDASNRRCGRPEVPLQLLAHGVRGVSYRPEHLRDRKSSDTTVLLRSTNIQGGRLQLEDVQLVPSWLVSEEQTARPQDIAVCMSNGSRSLVGKAAVFGDEAASTKLTVDAFCAIFRAKPTVDPRYLRQVFESHIFKAQVDEVLAGSAINNLNVGQVLRFNVPLPTPDEQRRIAALLSAVDERIRDALQMIDKLTKRRIGVTDRLLSADRAGAPRKLVPVRQFISTLESGVSVNSDDRPIASSAEAGVLKTSCVSGGRFFPEENKTVWKSDLNRVRVNPTAGCILISRMNTPELVGECGLVTASQEKLFLPDRLWQAVPSSDRVSFSWLNECLQWGPVRKKVKDAATGTSNSMKNISKSAFLAIEVPTPDYIEQCQIAETLETLRAEIAEEEAVVRKLSLLKKGLLEKLLDPSSVLARQGQRII